MHIVLCRIRIEFSSSTTYHSITDYCLKFCTYWFVALQFRSGFLSETLEQIDRQWEDDGGVLLGTDGVQSLQVSELDGRGAF